MARKHVASPFPTSHPPKLPPRLVTPQPPPARPPRSAPAWAIGAQIRVLRLAARTSGGELAARAGVSRSMLSRVERGLASPSVHTLDRLAAGLGVSISRFFADRRDRIDFLHVPAGGGIPAGAGLGTEGIEYRLLGHLLSAKLSVAPCLVHIDDVRASPKPVQQEGLKFVYILAGKMRYRYGPKEVSVHPGDSLLFDGTVEHGIVTMTELPIRYLCASVTVRA